VGYRGRRNVRVPGLRRAALVLAPGATFGDATSTLKREWKFLRRRRRLTREGSFTEKGLPLRSAEDHGWDAGSSDRKTAAAERIGRQISPSSAPRALEGRTRLRLATRRGGKRVKVAGGPAGEVRTEKKGYAHLARPQTSKPSTRGGGGRKGAAKETTRYREFLPW